MPEPRAPRSVRSEAVFPVLKRTLIERTGLSYFEDKDEDLAAIVDARLAELRLRGAAAYLDLLGGEAGERELHAVVTKMTIGETYFFRHSEQFDALRTIVFPDILLRNQHCRTLRVWSAGCATGAETYSISMLLRRDLAYLTAGWDIRIVGSDINADYLSAAAAGKYGEWALRSVSDEIRHQCFRASENRWEVAPQFRIGVEFLRHNLAADALPAVENPDLIICRNVMIYFSREFIPQLANRFHNWLPDRGWLLVGHAEANLDHFERFRTRDAPGTTLYQKLSAAPEIARYCPAVAFDGLPGQIGLPAQADTAGMLPVLQPETIPPAAPSPAPVAGWADVERLIAQNLWERAGALADELLAVDQIDSRGHYLKAILLEKADRPGEAEKSLRRSIYLDRGFAAAHYRLAELLERQNDLRAASRSYQTTLRLLANSRPDSEPVPLHKVAASALIEMLERKLETIQAA